MITVFYANKVSICRIHGQKYSVLIEYEVI